MISPFSYAGMRVFVSYPSERIVPRTWKERLFTKPWRPMQKTKLVVVPSVIGPDDCYKINGDLHCGERVYQQIKEQVGRRKNA